MKTIYLGRWLIWIVAGVMALVMTAHAVDNSQHKEVQGVSVYLGVLPGEMILGHPKAHPESGMHGGVPDGANRYHVIVALFDAKTGKRITGAKVNATVSPLALSGTRKKLELMLISGTVSYGNFFALGGAGIYRIKVEIELPGAAQPIETEFEYQYGRS